MTKGDKKRNWLQRLLFGLDDWQMVWEDSSHIEILYLFRAAKGWEPNVNYYRIYFTPSRNKYKLRLEGFGHHRQSLKYKEAVDKLNHFQNQLG
jgi:hypothetical protein